MTVPSIFNGHQGSNLDLQANVAGSLPIKTSPHPTPEQILLQDHKEFLLQSQLSASSQHRRSEENEHIIFNSCLNAHHCEYCPFGYSGLYDMYYTFH